ncbi:MAG: hypothetical protein K0S18_144 [Anaerocolumna sp.]|jgi:hypothetical protein|nr:hypothetical protein [Anaerocolumna sp.]
MTIFINILIEGMVNFMNGYELTAQSYEALMKRDNSNISKDDCESKIKVYRTLASLSESEIIEIFNSGAFNDVLKGYCKMALKNCGIKDNQISYVMDEIKWLLDTIPAAQVK